MGSIPGDDAGYETFEFELATGRTLTADDSGNVVVLGSTIARKYDVVAGGSVADQLLANPANWRIHPKAQQDAIAGALDADGWVQKVLVNRRSGFVVDGHARVALALTRREATVPVLYVDLEPDEEALVLATLDPMVAADVATHDMARPTGVGRGRTHPGSRRILIEGADEWISPAQESA